MKRQFKASPEVQLNVKKQDRERLSELGIEGEPRQDELIERIAQLVVAAETAVDVEWVPAKLDSKQSAPRPTGKRVQGP